MSTRTARLTSEERSQFIEQGYVILRGAVPQEHVQNALRAVNGAMGRGMSKEELRKADKGTLFSDVAQSHAIHSAFNETAVKALVSDAIGSEIPPIYGAQIALRFPGTMCTDDESFVPSPWWSRAWHIDGLPDENNVIPQGEIHSFTCLVGVYLNDIASDFSGNLVVYPRSHWRMEKHFQEHGLDGARQNGLRDLSSLHFDEPIQVRCNAGDVIIAHYQLAHSIAPNASPFIRYALYFRVNLCTGPNEHDTSRMMDIWKEWPAMRAHPPFASLKAAAARQNQAPNSSRAGGSAPAYVYALAARDDDERGALREKLVSDSNEADILFEAHKWEEAQPYYQAIIDRVPKDWVVQLKACVCFTFAPNVTEHSTEFLQLGEKCARRVCALSPQSLSGYSCLLQNLVKQKRVKESAVYVDALLQCPPQEAAPDDIKHSFQCIKHVATQYDSGQVDAWITHAARLYPSLKPWLEEFRSTELSSAELWAEGQKWLHGPDPKDLDAGFAIFDNICSVNPSDYWAFLLRGGCRTWQGRAKEGEPSIRKAIELDPLTSNGHALLCQNLVMQGRHAEAKAAAYAMLNLDLKKDGEYKEKITEALESVAKCNLTDDERSGLERVLKLKYPEVIAANPKVLDRSGCTVC